MLFMGMGAAAGGAAWAREAPKSAGGGFFLRGICPINSVGCLSGFMVALLKGVRSAGDCCYPTRPVAQSVDKKERRTIVSKEDRDREKSASSPEC